MYKPLLLLILFSIALASCTRTNRSTKKQLSIENKNTISLKKNSLSDSIVFDYDTLIWKELTTDNLNIDLDLRYATKNNFVKHILYNCPRCFLRPEVFDKIVLINIELLKKGYKLKFFDCYRPRPTQQKLWNIVPDARYVTPPQKGSMHNRGLAVDLTICDLNGKELDMGTEFDYFGQEAYQTYQNHSQKINANRKLLNQVMIKYGFKPIRTEWWHFSYANVNYPLSEWEWECK